MSWQQTLILFSIIIGALAYNAYRQWDLIIEMREDFFRKMNK